MSPRAFDSDDIRREGGALSFTEIIECPRCTLEFEAMFVDDSGCTEVEDIVDAPTGRHLCPRCTHRWVSALTGWNFYSEAG